MATAEVSTDIRADGPFDIFFSFEHQIEKKIIRLYDAMKLKFDVIICPNNINAMKPKNQKEEAKNDIEINESKIFICCLTKAYTFSKRCQNEIAFAYTKDKPMIVLMFEKLSNQDLCTIAYGLSNISKFNLYDDTKIFETWDGSLFETVVKAIERLLKRKIRKPRFEQGKLKKRGSIGLKPPIPSVISSTSYEDVRKEIEKSEAVEAAEALALLPTATIVSFEAMEYGTSQKEVVQEDETFPGEMLNLVRYKSNSYLETCNSFGYNRVVFMASKQRYLMTSSLNKTITSLDVNGNWIERKNPGGRLKQPFAICLTRNDEILIGDNMAKCIFVFDSNLKYLKSIAQETVVGFTDMDVDPANNDLYAVSLYDSLIVIIDMKTGKLKRKIFLSTPAYIRVTTAQLFVISAADLIYAINKSNLEANYTIRLRHNKYVNGLFIDKFENVYTTAHVDNFDEDENQNENDKSKEVYLCYISFQDGVKIKRVNLGLTQVNDFILFENKQITCINDTHVDMFKFDGFQKSVLRSKTYTIIDDSNSRHGTRPSSSHVPEIASNFEHPIIKVEFLKTNSSSSLAISEKTEPPKTISSESQPEILKGNSSLTKIPKAVEVTNTTDEK